VFTFGLVVSVNDPLVLFYSVSSWFPCPSWSFDSNLDSSFGDS
jgi:hypothetical protein